MTSVIIRIGLRYVAGILVAKGIADAALARDLQTDAALIGMLEAAAGFVAAAIAERWYWLARRMGWEK